MLVTTVRFFLENRLVTFLLLITLVGWGLSNAPFALDVPGLPRDPVAVDAIPDIGENQQIVYVNWPGQSPQDVQNQITYPLTSALLGVPGVKSVRSNSMFGLASIYLIFEEDVEFYWSRSRILERLSSLPSGVLPEGVSPALGPDATALGQVFWYTLEGRDPASGASVGGWDLQELRSIQDFTVLYALSAANGVAEVASVGGFVKEYQIDLDPDAMRSFGVSLEEVMAAVQGSNLDVGASTLEINLAEYYVRGLGYIQSIGDLESATVRQVDNVPVRLSDVARINIGPAERRGLLDKSGAEAVGGVVVARFGANPLAVIEAVKERVATLAPGLPTRTLDDGTVSQVTVVPYYDRSVLIYETIGTLEEALTLEILITAIVVILMLLNFRSSLLVAGLLPVAVLMCFIAMKQFGVDANVVALSGIAIAIGTMVDMGIVLTESIVLRLRGAPDGESVTESIYEATMEVAGAVLTAVATTVVSFLPVFAMEAAEGKLFRPLALTKTFALVAAIIVAVCVLPALARALWGWKSSVSKEPSPGTQRLKLAGNILLAVLLAFLLARAWMPLGVSETTLANFVFVALVAGGLILAFWGIIYSYETILRVLLRVKWLFLLVVGGIVWAGISVYQQTGQEFMPALGEGTFLLMPTAMPHAGVQENLANLRALDMAITTIPEVDMVVGKAGRATTPLDPAPLSMYETVVQYASEYATDADGRRVRFVYDDDTEAYTRDQAGELVLDDDGRYFRQWRDHIKSPDDIWEEIVQVAKLPGVTSAPKLQPIETRLVMLQTGMRAPMGIKVYGGDLASIEAFGLQLEVLLREVEGVKAGAVFADRIVGKPYLLIDIDRDAIARYGLSVTNVQQVLQVAVGGMPLTETVEGRERYKVRLRYPRELRNDPESLRKILVPTQMGGGPRGQTVPLGDLVDIRYEQGPQSIKSEDGFLVGYVLFDRLADYPEVEVVEAAQARITAAIEAGELAVPAGLSYRFAGNYEQQVRASERLAIVLPIALALIFLILYLQFRSVAVTLMVFSGVAVAFSGGFLLLGAYSTDWFLNFDAFGINLRDLFQVHTINLSVAVWVGFLALFGIATDDGVLVATFLRDSFRQNEPTTVAGIRDAVVEGGLRRVRPAMMTTATTLLALLPVLTSTGRGSDIMVPMAIPSFGGMALQVITMFTVPVLWAGWRETRLWWRQRGGWSGASPGAFAGLLTLGLSVTLPQNLHAQRLPLITNELAALTDTMYARNPELQALSSDYAAAQLDAAQVSALPDIELGAGAGLLPIETRLGPQLLRLGATQMLPWPGLLKARADVANARASPVLAQATALQLDLRYQLASRYYELARIDAARDLLLESLDLYASLDALALSRVRAATGSTVDVYRIQLARAEVEQRNALLLAGRAGVLAQLNQLLARDPTSPLEPPAIDSLLSGGDSVDSITSVLLLLPSLDARHPLVQIYERQAEVSRRALAANKLESKPGFGVGLDYVWTGQRNDAEPMSNGRDAVIPLVMLRIPLSQRRFQASAQQEQYRLQAIASRRKSTIDKLVADAAAAQATVSQANIQLAYLTAQLATLEPTVRIATTEYASDLRGFDELVDFQQQAISYHLQRVEAQAQLLTARAELAKLLAL